MFTTDAIKNEKRGYVKYCLDNFDRSSKKMWQNIRNMNIRSKQINRTIPDHFNIPDEINNHFFITSGNSTDADEDLSHFCSNNLKCNYEELLRFKPMIQ